MSNVKDLARAIKPQAGPARILQGLVVPATPPSPAHSMVQLGDGSIIPVPGMAVVGGQVTLVREGNVTTWGYCPMAGCEVARSTALAVANKTVVSVTWPTVVTDTGPLAGGGLTYATANSSTITIRESGLYAMNFAMTWSVYITGRAFAQFVTTGSTAVTHRMSISTLEDKGAVTATLRLKVGDTVTVSVYHETGSSRNVASASLSVWRIAW